MGLLLLLPLIPLIKYKNKTAVILVALLGLSLGLWRGGIYMQKLNDIKTLSGQVVTIEASASTDSVYGFNSQIEFNAKNAVLLEPGKKPLSGSYKISGFGVPMVYRGDRIQVTGKIYPMRGSNQARMAYAQLSKVGSDKSWINQLTRNFSAGMRNALPEPASSFGLGILVGQRSSLPEEVYAQLTIVGLVHIVAVSGYNLTIITRAIARLRLGSKFQRLSLSLLLISLFVLVTGFSASIVRASVVAGLSLLAWYYGRRINPITLIAFTAALTGLVKPFYVWSDLGWYLSFLAFFGVLVIAPLVARRLFQSSPRALSMIFIETFCAEIMTLPLIMMTFSHLSFIGLLANLLVVPLIPIAMLLAAVAGLAGTAAPEIAGWFSWPANLVLTYILDLARILSELPWAFVKASIAPVLMIGFYSIVVLVVVMMRRKISPDNYLIAGRDPI